MPALPADSQPSTPTTPVTYRSWTRWPWPRSGSRPPDGWLFNPERRGCAISCALGCLPARPL